MSDKNDKSPRTYKCFELGTEVLIGENIPGRIIGIWFEANFTFKYQVVWWDFRERKTEYFYPFEIRLQSEAKECEIGFITERKSITK